MKLAELTAYLDAYLRVEEVPDYPNALNGLQVDGPDEVSRIAVAVDACQVTIDAAVNHGAQLLLVHHGLFWKGLEPLTGRHGKRVRALLTNAVGLYAAHLPLDLHPDVGNNALLSHRLSLTETQPFGEYEGVAVGVRGRLIADRGTLVNRVEEALGVRAHLIPGGPERTLEIGIVTGSAGSMIADAHAAGLDTFITGEGAHHTYFDAEELGVNVIYAGHYATETVGVIALGEHLEDKFGLPYDFIDHPTGL